MKTAKQETLELVEQLPDDVSMEIIMAELHFKAKVLHAIEQADRGQVVSDEEARRRLSKWLA